MVERTVVKREDLYEQVWTESGLTVARRLGISSVALSKICKKLNVPIPGRGYWARVRSGQKPKKPPLPASKPGQRMAHEIIQRRVRLDDLDHDAGGMTERPKGESPIVVAERLSRPHRLVKMSAPLLKKAKKGVNVTFEEACLDVNVSRNQIDRALRIMDALLKAFDALGHTVEVTQPGRQGRYSENRPMKKSQTQVVFESIRVLFSIEEGRDRIQKKELVRKWTIEGDQMVPDYESVPNGRLILRIESCAYMGLRGKWADGKKQRVENCLDEFVRTVLTCGRLLKEREEEWDRQCKVRMENERLRKREEERLQDLGNRLKSFEEARRVEALVEAVRERGCESKPAVEEWLRWAENRIDGLRRYALGRFPASEPGS